MHADEPYRLIVGFRGPTVERIETVTRDGSSRTPEDAPSSP
ncbi:MAG: hypothetical protein AAGH64_10825 [Planctomycetota bacterium]